MHVVTNTCVQSPHTVRTHSLDPSSPSCRRYAEADGAYKAALLLRPSLPEAWCGIGVTQRLRGQLDEAVTSFHRALAIRPAHGPSSQLLHDTLTHMASLPPLVLAAAAGAGAPAPAEERKGVEEEEEGDRARSAGSTARGVRGIAGGVGAGARPGASLLTGRRSSSGYGARDSPAGLGAAGRGVSRGRLSFGSDVSSVRAEGTPTALRQASWGGEASWAHAPHAPSASPGLPASDRGDMSLESATSLQEEEEDDGGGNTHAYEGGDGEAGEVSMATDDSSA